MQRRPQGDDLILIRATGAAEALRLRRRLGRFRYLLAILDRAGGGGRGAREGTPDRSYRQAYTPSPMSAGAGD